GKRMFAGFGILLVLMAVIAIVGAMSLSTLEKHLESIAVERTTKTALSNVLYDNANQIYIDLQAMLLTDDADKFQALREDIATTRNKFAAAYDELSAMSTTPESRQRVTHVSEVRSAAVKMNDQVVQLVAAGEREQAQEFLEQKAAAGLQAWRDAVAANLEGEAKEMEQAREEAMTAASRARVLLFVARGLAILVGMFLAVVFTRSLTGPLGLAAAAARDLAAGRMDGARLVGGADEVGDVLRAVQATRESVQTVIEATKEMGRQHDLGAISARLDPSVVQGDYSSLMEVVNAVVNEHVQAALTAGRLAGAYARG